MEAGNGHTVDGLAISTAVSSASDPDQAVRSLHSALAMPNPGLVVVFASSRYAPSLLEQAFAETFGDVAIIGCATDGEISGDGYINGALTSLALADHACIVSSVLLSNVSQCDQADIRAAAESLVEDMESRGIVPAQHTTFCLLLISGEHRMEEQVIGAINAVLGGLQVFGGSAPSGRGSPCHGAVIHGGRFHPDAAVITLVNTSLPFKAFSAQHFVGTGEQVIVTGADPDNRIVTELNGECAAFEYARLLGRDVEDLRAFDSMLPPLMVRIGGAWYARSIERITPDNSLHLACAIDEGVPLSVGRNSGMLNNLRQTLQDVNRSIGPPAAILGFDCIMRRIEVQSSGLQADMARIFADNKVVGCSAFGEQFNGLHLNHTFTGVAFSSAPAASLPQVFHGTEEGSGEVERLESENAKLRKTVRVLLQRLERSMNVPSDTFSLFQNNVLLETTIKRRTEELAELNRQLNSELVARREMEEALLAAKQAAEEASGSKTTFLAAISHDLQQPLNAARLLLGALAQERLSNSGKGLLGRIEGALEAAEEMLTDFLDVARLEAGGITPRMTDVDIGPLLSQLEAEYGPQAKRRGLRLRVRRKPVSILTDSHLLQRILRNLLANSIRYTERGGVLIGCRHRGDKLRIEVWDTGIGIPVAQIGEVFKPFHRINATGESGSGLGLTIAQNMAEMLGHSLSFRSMEGKGTVFAVEVARAYRPDGSVSPPAGFSILANQTILIIDDDRDSRDSLATILRAWGCNPLAAANVAEAALQRRTRPDLAIIDYHLGDNLTGLDAINTLWPSSRGRPPILMVSANSSPTVIEQIRNCGYEFLAKPINPARLRSTLSYLLNPPR